MTEKHSAYFNLNDAFKEDHCPLCYLARRAVWHFLDSVFYEQVNDPGVRATLKRSWGFCEKHFRHTLEMGNPLGVAIIGKHLLETIRSEWADDVERHQKEKKAALCPACEIWDKAVNDYAALLIENLGDSSFVFDYERSCGLCIPHFKKIYAGIEDKKIRKRILDVELEKADVFIRELEEFIRKNDYRFADEKFGREGSAWRRAVEFLKGNNEAFHEKK